MQIVTVLWQVPIIRPILLAGRVNVCEQLDHKVEGAAVEPTTSWSGSPTWLLQHHPTETSNPLHAIVYRYPHFLDLGHPTPLYRTDWTVEEFVVIRGDLWPTREFTSRASRCPRTQRSLLLNSYRHFIDKSYANIAIIRVRLCVCVSMCLWLCMSIRNITPKRMISKSSNLE